MTAPEPVVVPLAYGLSAIYLRQPPPSSEPPRPVAEPFPGLNPADVDVPPWLLPWPESYMAPELIARLRELSPEARWAAGLPVLLGPDDDGRSYR